MVALASPAGFSTGFKPVIPGNLPTDIRNRVRNRDGSISTVRTMSIGTDQGEVLIPTVIGGRVVSDDAAIAHYRRTGENFGVFRTPDEATGYAQDLHRFHESQLKQGGGFNPQGISGERITSTYRDPARNRRVGGVANSYHTRRGLNGEPLARDSVPPKGMGMAEYYQRLKALNPGMDVINEGDHIHIEPRS